jgi:hypothetical protein
MLEIQHRATSAEALGVIVAPSTTSRSETVLIEPMVLSIWRLESFELRWGCIDDVIVVRDGFDT